MVWKKIFSLQEEGRRGWFSFRENICTHIGHAYNFLAQPRSEEDPVIAFISFNAGGGEREKWP